MKFQIHLLKARSRSVLVLALALLSAAAPAHAEWRESAFLTAADGAQDDRFGTVAYDGDTLVVGVGAADINGVAGQGALYVYVRPVAGWVGDLVQVAKLTASDGELGDALGSSVAIDGDTIVAGAAGEDTEGTDSGAAYVFVKPPGGWTDATETAKLLASSLNGSERFGDSIAIDGTTVAVGAPGENTVFVYERPGGGWTDATSPTATLGSFEIVSGNQFGSEVGISGTVIVAGAGARDSGAGALYLFEKPGPTWVTTVTHTAKLLASDRIAGDQLGLDGMDVEGDVVVAGVRTRTVAFGTQGQVYLWSKPLSGWAGTLTETATVIAADGGGGDHFGSDVDMAGDVLVVGAAAADAIGAGYRFEKPATGWIGQISDGGRLDAADPAGVQSLGLYVAAAPDVAFLAAPNGDIGAVMNQGFVLAFRDLPCPVAPRDDCATGASGKGKLQLSSRDGLPDKNALAWKWSKGEEVDVAALGDPLDATEYTMCIYDGSGEQIVSITLPAGGDCSGKPCWKQTGNGFKFKDKTGTNRGVTGFGIKAGAAGKSKLNLKARGAALTVPALPLGQSPDPVFVQLENSSTDACWSAQFSAPASSKNGKWSDSSD
ncbi:MAG TPA: FG-GAP repeat protein [Candidatus Binatia bacterium]|nr:FG-GAP repeat protein [Candidatus Binatia bacterium]